MKPIIATFIMFSSLVSAYADQIALPIDVQDGLENMWSVQKNGYMYTKQPKSFLYRDKYYYCPAPVLSVDETTFPAHESATRILHESGTELQIGPKVIGSVHVTRKIFFGKGEGYVRFLEIFDNKSTTPVSVKVSLYSKPRDSNIVWNDDHCVVVSGNNATAIEFFSGIGGANQPTRDKSVSHISYWWDSIPIQPQSKVAILHFLAIRPKREQALEFAQAFDVAPACIDIDPSDLATIINYDPRTLGAKAGIEIFRGEEKEALLLKSGDKLTGTVQNENFRIQTSYAQLEFSASDIATVIYEGGANNIERIVVLNGDVFSGFILDAEVAVKLDAGPLIKIRKEKISKLGFRVRADEKEKYPVKHDITLTNGDHFSGTIKNQSLKIGAAFGEMPVEIEQIAKIEFISKKGTVTEITLKNGDKVSGFFKR
ncbi:MAG: hypothetical protein ACIAQZ_01645 [Sedimentisphaeraceae bacterium JB056]